MMMAVQIKYQLILLTNSHRNRSFCRLSYLNCGHQDNKTRIQRSAFRQRLVSKTLDQASLPSKQASQTMDQASKYEDQADQASQILLEKRAHSKINMATIPLMDDVEYGGKNDEGIQDDFMYRNNVHNASVQIRLGFLRKVYSLLFVQLLLTTIIGFTLISVGPAKLFVQENTWMITLGFISNIVILIALHIKRKETPINFILLAIFTVVEAYTIGVIVSFYDQYVVLQAFLLTVLVLGGLTAYTFQTKRDFSNLGIVLFSALIILIVGGLIQLFVRSTTFEFALSIFGAFIFALFIVYDTQNLMLRVSPEEYILATIELYLDIINLFLYILRALDAARR
ncbi:hypothetical protein GE061_015501 [Apolygus lucorum]|uniref:Uncharacterized protein n=1 Tax=Apolygus lucorum TaxID=248454 RepID=A0A8S9XL50_APOLU|nr:hypothetical protein GE061_015501 [Apolygus lucorum]